WRGFVASFEEVVQFSSAICGVGRIEHMRVPRAKRGIYRGEIADLLILTDEQVAFQLRRTQFDEDFALSWIKLNRLAGIAKDRPDHSGADPDGVVQHEDEEREHDRPQPESPGAEPCLERLKQHRRPQQEERDPDVAAREMKRLHRPEEQIVIGERERYGEPEEKEALPQIEPSDAPASCHGNSRERADEAVGRREIPIVENPWQRPLLLQRGGFRRDLGQKYQIATNVHDADHEKGGGEPDRWAICRTKQALRHRPGT